MPCRPRRRPVRRGPGRVRGTAPECGLCATGAATRRRRGAGGGGPLPATTAASASRRRQVRPSPPPLPSPNCLDAGSRTWAPWRPPEVICCFLCGRFVFACADILSTDQCAAWRDQIPILDTICGLSCGSPLAVQGVQRLLMPLYGGTLYGIPRGDRGPTDQEGFWGFWVLLYSCAGSD